MADSPAGQSVSNVDVLLKQLSDELYGCQSSVQSNNHLDQRRCTLASDTDEAVGVILGHRTSLTFSRQVRRNKVKHKHLTEPCLFTICSQENHVQAFSLLNPLGTMMKRDSQTHPFLFF